jgi:lysyl-tRNA synthetase class 2
MSEQAKPVRRPRWWTPEELARRLPNLRVRAALADAVRGYFKARDFVEVETPALQVSPGLEAHLVAFETEIQEPFRDGRRARLYLHTSPEFAMKKLLVAGVPRLFQLARTYRNAERSPTHHPEFTMLEWYRANASYRDAMADCEGLLHACANVLGGSVLFRRGEHTCDPHAEWQYLSVAEGFQRHAGVDLLATAPDPEHPDVERLRAEAARIGVFTNPRDRWDDVFFRIFLERIEPKLGVGRPTVLYDYPLSMAALARRNLGDPQVAERFEVYVCGLELANAFGELTDAAEQRRRFERDQALKAEHFGYSYPIDEDFLAALVHGMPESAGVALGFDRLVMLTTGAPSITDVLWAPVAEAD